MSEESDSKDKQERLALLKLRESDLQSGIVYYKSLVLDRTENSLGKNSEQYKIQIEHLQKLKQEKNHIPHKLSSDNCHKCPHLLTCIKCTEDQS